MSNRHKVFVSYHHEDQRYKDRFEHRFSKIYDIMVANSVQTGDIDTNCNPERISQIIRDKYLKDTTVTIVLVGEHTWRRKHVDWEISFSIRDTNNNPRSGLLGILLPTYPTYPKPRDPYTIPPRLHDNIECGFAEIYNWRKDPVKVQAWIHEAFKQRNVINPHNTRELFRNNRKGERWYD